MKNNRLERILFRIIPNYLLRRIIPRFKKYSFFNNTKNSNHPISFDIWYNQKILGFNRSAYWQVSKLSKIINPRNIYVGKGSAPGYNPGNYIQALGKIFIGNYVLIAPNVGIISSNHDLYNTRKHYTSEVKIGNYCWIGMGAIILPNVTLQDYTIVAAGSVVTKSFQQGFCIIAGNPAKIVKFLNEKECTLYKDDIEYNGYIKSEEFKENISNYTDYQILE